MGNCLNHRLNRFKDFADDDNMNQKLKYNPNIHHRRSIRLKGYDYSQAGLYFITICCQDRAHLFGQISNGIMALNDAGKMVVKWYYELENKFPDIKCHEMITMPNHFHCIIENVGSVAVDLIAANHVGADLRVCPINKTKPINKTEPVNKTATNNDGEPVNKTGTNNDALVNRIEGEHIGSPQRMVVQWFKTMSTNEYIRGVKNLNWQLFNGKLWQRNYYEHIIRDERSYENISAYIINNPAKWSDDKFHIQ